LKQLKAEEARYSENLVSLPEMKRILLECDSKIAEKRQLLMREEQEFRNMKSELVQIYLQLSRSIAT
jgi:hypothetical protein